MHKFPIFDANGRTTHVGGVAIDITEQVRARSALVQVNQALQRANADLRQFSYAASHDLREPLRQVALYTQLLEQEYRGRLDSRADLYLDYSLKAAQRMHDLIGQLLAYIRLADEEPPAGEVDANRVLATVIENLRLPISESGATVTTDLLPALRVHEAHLTQIFQNLLGNALQYRSFDRAPAIHIGARREEHAWVLSVRDNGIGVPPAYHERIFRIFQRLHAERSGTGMGLAICHKIVERYAGKIWVESDGLNGSVFYVRLPAHP